MFGSTQVHLKLANVSIVSKDPHRRLVAQRNIQLYTMCTNVQCTFILLNKPVQRLTDFKSMSIMVIF